MDLPQLEIDVCAFACESPDDFPGIVHAILADQPPGRLWCERQSNQKKDREDPLQST